MTELSELGVDLGPTDRLYIGGQWVKPSTPATIDVINPATEEILCRVAEATAADVGAAVMAARTAFDEGPWPRLTPAQRAPYLYALADQFEKRSAEVAHLWSKQVGVIHAHIATVGTDLAAALRFYGDLASDFPFIERHRPSTGGGVGLLVREPVGVVGAIIPWNSPMMLLAYKIAPALLAGCTVIIKMSPEAPADGYLFAQFAEAAGLPPGVVNMVTADRDASEALVKDPRVDKITFTGSTAVGRRIGAIMAERIGRVTLELGGKSPAVVLDDADIGAVALTAGGAMSTLCGQGCSTITRLIVTRKRHDDLVDALVAGFGANRIGDPYDPQAQMGPLAMQRQLQRVEGYIAKGISEGASLASGGKRPEHFERGYFLEPTVFAEVDNASTIAQQEIFGPVLAVVPARDEEHAINLANDTMYGLNASVFTSDPERGYAVARRLRSGTVAHNGWASDFGIAFGGFKQSGIGREGGREGLYPYLETKTVILNDEVADSLRLRE